VELNELVVATRRRSLSQHKTTAKSARCPSAREVGQRQRHALEHAPAYMSTRFTPIHNVQRCRPTNLVGLCIDAPSLPAITNLSEKDPSVGLGRRWTTTTNSDRRRLVDADANTSLCSSQLWTNPIHAPRQTRVYIIPGPNHNGNHQHHRHIESEPSQPNHGKKALVTDGPLRGPAPRARPLGGGAELRVRAGAVLQPVRVLRHRRGVLRQGVPVGQLRRARHQRRVGGQHRDAGLLRRAHSAGRRRVRGQGLLHPRRLPRCCGLLPGVRAHRHRGRLQA
jgi:hypothetical protein